MFLFRVIDASSIIMIIWSRMMMVTFGYSTVDNDLIYLDVDSISNSSLKSGKRNDQFLLQWSQL